MGDSKTCEACGGVGYVSEDKEPDPETAETCSLCAGMGVETEEEEGE